MKTAIEKAGLLGPAIELFEKIGIRDDQLKKGDLTSVRESLSKLNLNDNEKLLFKQETGVEYSQFQSALKNLELGRSNNKSETVQEVQSLVEKNNPFGTNKK
jgi:hypothetical protein